MSLKEIKITVKSKAHSFCFYTEDSPLEGPILTMVCGMDGDGRLSVTESEEAAWEQAEKWFYETHPYWVGKGKKRVERIEDDIYPLSFDPPEDEEQ